MQYIKYLDYPKLPDNIEKNILDTVEKFIDCEYTKDRFVTDNTGTTSFNEETNLGISMEESRNYFSNLAQFQFIQLNQPVKDWLANNIGPGLTAHIQVISAGNHVPPHIDEREVRTTALNYLLTTGGNVSTTFYRVGAQYTHLTAMPRTLIPLERLEVIETTIIPAHTWHSLSVSNIHGVKNIDISLKRIALSINLHPIEFGF